MTFASLRALHALIGAAIDDMERVYHERSPNLDYPSIDKPYYKAAEHTPEEELAETLASDPSVAAAAKQIVAACGHLSHTVNKPWFGLMEDVQAGQFSECIRFMETANVVEILREAGPEGLHVDELLKQILALRPKTNPAAGDGPLTPAHLGHILRLLATSHYLREVKPNVFANNRVSSYIDSGKSVAYLCESPDKKYTDTDGVAAFVALTGDEAIKFCACITDWALPDLTPTDAIDVNYALESSSDQAETKSKENKWVAPFNLAFNTQLGYFPWLEQPGNEARFNRFGHAMTGTRQWETKNFILQGFSWEDLPEGSVLIDVGGGIGATSIIVAEAHPHLRVVVEDREQVVSTAVSAWGPQYAPLFESGRMSYRPRDFFESWDPLTLSDGKTVNAPSVFMVRLVLHDWSDDDSRKILSRLRAAAGPDTKLLIGDMLLPFACHDDTSPESSFAPKDSPLLPNLGKGNVHGYLIDIMMMGMFNAREKTVAEMSALLLSAGWKVTDIRRTPGNLWAYTTAVPV
ncbi:S-adenosyl-L-methionine-dependent methyltransferase [Lentinus tigrinus ALCF2SS1-7]|uniref:S-adenosyl-L-methionine-dependent methyltransferase n=1 Tax=Lentinus tigrinus ALCF2SS1-6 TaxID=1328759 RepID=A0A5C2S3F4_9APHY|nr:S-adenosyl-L-methionine-dependent methyltransferase [Lentinus tigrinus ALCF2SS1-6]RPD72298.1 S-adenosyl-L-methionine-dependent methyltransferase [Lentinus tigrinus ALCF2SS1-7]